MKTRTSLDDIRDVITSLKKKNGGVAAEVTAEEVRTELSNKGSNSTNGPLIRSMLDEAILAEHLDYSKISNRLKAAFMAEIRRVADESTNELRTQLHDSAQSNDQLHEKYATVSAELTEIKLKSVTDQITANEKMNQLDISLGEAKGKISTFDEIKQNLTAQKDEAKKDLDEKREEITTLKINLNSAVNREGEASQKVEDLRDRLSKSEVDRLTEAKGRETAENKVVFIGERIVELKSDNARLVGQNNKLMADIEQLNKELLKMAEEKSDACARLDEQSRSAKGKKGKGSNGDNTGP